MQPTMEPMTHSLTPVTYRIAPMAIQHGASTLVTQPLAPGIRPNPVQAAAYHRTHDHAIAPPDLTAYNELIGTTGVLANKDYLETICQRLLVSPILGFPNLEWTSPSTLAALEEVQPAVARRYCILLAQRRGVASTPVQIERDSTGSCTLHLHTASNRGPHNRPSLHGQTGCAPRRFGFGVAEYAAPQDSKL